jgi:hypothetical protein
MKLTTDRPFANVDAAMRKLLELAKVMEADAGRLSVGTLRFRRNHFTASTTPA